MQGSASRVRVFGKDSMAGKSMKLLQTGRVKGFDRIMMLQDCLLVPTLWKSLDDVSSGTAIEVEYRFHAMFKGHSCDPGPPHGDPNHSG